MPKIAAERNSAPERAAGLPVPDQPPAPFAPSAGLAVTRPKKVAC